MKAWTVAVVVASPHGQQITTWFLCAETRSEAVAAASRNALDQHAPECPAGVVGTVYAEVAADVIRAAAEQMAEV